MSKTIARALKDRKTIALNIGKVSQRALTNAVQNLSRKRDFDCQEHIQKYLDEQHNLRVLKTQIAKKTASFEVLIPENCPTQEAGTKVPLVQAILIRDDLKAQRGYFEKYLSLNNIEQKYDRETNKYEEVELERYYDFQEMVKKVDDLQDHIDTIDALIQFTDNTEKV